MPFTVSIVEQPNVIDDHLLDIIGNEFKFSHEKGIPEWLKNSVDAYIREEPHVPDDAQHIVLHFRDGSKAEPPVLECLDFCGMTSADIDKAFKRWGDPKAASRGLNKRTYGGHGNGGKFYMRQMFERSHFITYRNGRLNVFGFSENRRYGYDRKLKDKPCGLQEAMKLAAIDKLELPAAIKEQIREGLQGFTLVRGVRPGKIRGVIPVERLCDKVRLHPQARKIVQRKPISILRNGRLFLSRLEAVEIERRPGFEEIAPIPIPARLRYEEEGIAEEIPFSSNKYPGGQLTLSVAKEPFGRIGRLSELNCIDILGEIGAIGSYRVEELVHIKQHAQAEFIFGECFCPILEDPDEDCVKNDREKLIDNHRTRALLRWIAEEVDNVGRQIEREEASNRKQQNLKLADEFNRILNTWKNRFLEKLLSEMLGGPGLGSSAGGAGTEGSGGGTRARSETKGGSGEKGAAKGGGEGDQRKVGQRHPVVLLSGRDPDPLDDGQTLNLSERHPAVYQRAKDVEAGIYWINTSRPLPTAILDHHVAESSHWKLYHFQRFVDIIVLEALQAMEKRGMELTFDSVQSKINEVIKTLHDSALENLGHYLL